MNTPAHVVLNLLVLSGWKRDQASNWFTPVAAGALVPDAPMVLFYLWEKVIRLTPESVIWSERHGLGLTGVER